MRSNSLSVLLYNTLKENKVYLVYTPLVVYWIILFVLTTTPTDVIPHLFRKQDKLEHLVAYFLLAVLLSLAMHFQKRNKSFSEHALLITLILILTYGAIDELHQTFIPGRFADIIDWMADATGGCLGIALSYYFLKKGST